jgi:pyruvate dehydrogenase E2 component (dihydrolipoamide acetyltransferase)/2-oxoglutarate dehydrogenase E2 component (dihydrolipoamide succinyltransferase)
MAAYIAIPKLGMSMTEATVNVWKVQEGDRVEEGDIVLEIETDKTEWEVECTASGFVHLLVQEDVTVPVGRVVGLIAETEEELAALQKEPAREIYTTAPEPVEAPPAAAAASSPAQARAERPEGIRISPLARKMAQEHRLDLTTIRGTGPDGRIVREDIEKSLEARERETASAEAFQGNRAKATVPLKGMRRAIAEHMQRSLSVAAQLSYMGEIDMTEVIKLRSALIEQEGNGGVRITYTDILVAAIAKVLKDNPIVNSSVVGNEIKVWEDINIGVAVALEDGLEGGLIVPVVRNADQKSVRDIGLEVGSLVEKARSGKLMPDDVTGGTFTLTNLGAVGGGYLFATPIVNQPQSAILGTAAICDRPVVRDGQVVVRPVMTYSFTFDHRAIDGAPAARFVDDLARLLENPDPLLRQ